MSKAAVAALALVVGLVLGIPLGGRFSPPALAPAAAAPESGVLCRAERRRRAGRLGAVRGGRRWPQDLSTLPGHEQWTYGGARGIFAESPNRVFLLGGGELPKIARPQTRLFPRSARTCSFRSRDCRGATRTRRRRQERAARARTRRRGWRSGEARQRRTASSGRLALGALVVVVNAKGNIIEEWTQWDKLFKRPHAVYISPYDAEKHVWVVDDHTHAIYKFTNDGKQLVQTIGTPNVPGADGTHFNRPTFMAWLPDGSFYVSDGYNGTRVAKFDADGKFQFDFGMRGDPGKETRPGYMNNVHGVAVDLETRRVFVNDRDNHRIQIFDEKGTYLSEWKIAVSPSSLHFVQIGADRAVVTFDRNTHKMLKYDLDGHLLYAWGTVADFPGTLWGVHGMSTDQEGNLYVAEVDAGRFQKFRPRPGANPAYLIGKPVYSAWK